jgi:hypothetical protein
MLTNMGQPIYGQICSMYNVQCPFAYGGGGSGTGTVQGPQITGITPSSGQEGSTISVVITGSSFGSSIAALTLSGINGQINGVTQDGTQINATFDLTTLNAGSYSVAVNVARFDGGSSQSNTWPFTVNPVQVTTGEVVVIGWINGGAITLPSAANAALVAALNGSTDTCTATVLAWFSNSRILLNTSTDVDYANAWLLKHSANNAPPTTISPSTQLSGGDFRLFNDFQVTFFESAGLISSAQTLKGTVAVGTTPDPCGSGTHPAGESHPSNGAAGITPSATSIYQLAEGRVGSFGQAVSQTINGRTVPWIWGVIRFDISGNPITTDHAMFPTYYVYKNGTRIATYTQSSPSTFIALDASYQRLPSEIQ